MCFVSGIWMHASGCQSYRYLRQLCCLLILGVILTTGVAPLWCQYTAVDSVVLKFGSITRPLTSTADGRTIIFDTCSQIAWSGINQQTFTSSDFGATWVGVGTIDTNFSNQTSPNYFLDGCTVYCKWESKVNDSRFRLARNTNGAWEIFEDPGMYWMHSRLAGLATDSLIVVEPSPIDSLSVSWDGGKTWNHINYPSEQRSYHAKFMQVPVKGKIAVFLADAGAMEFTSATKQIRTDVVPAQTVQYKYFDDQHLISTQRYKKKTWDGKDSSSLAISSDGGATWKIRQSIQDTYTGATVHGLNDSLHVRWIGNIEGSSCTIILASGLIANTTDYGHSWVFHGMVRGDVLHDGMEQVSLAPDKALFCCVANTTYRLLSGTELLEIISTNTPNFYSICAFDSLRIVGLADWGSYYSADGGRTWQYSTLVPYARTIGTVYDLPEATPDRLVVANDSIYLFSSSIGDVLSYSNGTLGFEYTARRYLAGSSYFACDDSRFVQRGPPLSSFDGSSMLFVGEQSISNYSRAGNRWEWSPNSVDSVSGYYRLPGKNQFVFADSLYSRSADSVPWVVVGNGLPAYNQNLPAVSSLVATSNDVLLCGFRGYAFDGDSGLVTIPGGIYASTDNGVTWQESATNLSYNPYVWQILAASGSELYASTSFVKGSSASSSMLASENAIVKSTDGGLSWQVVHRFTSPQRVATHAGHRMSIAGDGTVYALGDNEVVYSTDHGGSWQTFTNEFLLTGCLTDIAAGPDNRVYVGTTQGVFIYDAVTSVAGDDDHLRYTSVWLYPTPTHGVATVRVNNLDLVDVSQCSLTLYNQYGDQCADLSSNLRGHAGQRRMEFTYETTHLPPGLYILVLQSPSGVVENYKMMVVR